MANESKKHRDKEKVQLDLGKLLLSPSDHAHDENTVIPKDIIEILKSIGEVTIKKPN